MATISNGWYKGSIPFYEITEITVSATGSGAESWEVNGVVCYRSGTKVVIVCDSVTAIGEKAFFKFLALKKISGLGAVTTIGAYAFCYTPNLAYIDIVPGKLTSIGDSAFRMSSAEDTLDLSAVSLNIIGDMATRHKRWGADGLAAVKAVPFPQNIYMEVPNMDSQFAYPDVQYGIKNGEPCYINTSGCSALTCYHIWNAIFAGTDKQYDNWLDWFNDIVNTDGTYASTNAFDGNVVSRLTSKIGWTSIERIMADSAAQLQTIIGNLQKGYPMYLGMHSVNVQSAHHAIAVVGCDINTHKLAIVDSSVLEERGVVSWIAFEDIFVSGTSEYDSVYLFSFNFPVLAPNNTWYTQGGTTVKQSSITEVHIMDTYTPTGTVVSSWDASAAKDGSIMAYVEGTKLTLCGNGSGKIALNPDSSKVFSGDSTDTRFTNLKIINGGDILDVSNVTDMTKMFNYCKALKSIDVSSWRTANVLTMHTVFQQCNVIDGLDVSNWFTGKVAEMIGMFNQCNALSSLDVSNWDTSKCTNMRLMFQSCISLPALNLTKWDVGNVTNMGSMFLTSEENITMNLTTIGNVSNWNTGMVTSMAGTFQNCRKLKDLNVSDWNTGICENFSNAFRECASLEELDFSSWDTSSATNMYEMLTGCSGLKKITLGEKFSFKGNGSLTGTTVATMPTPNSTNIPGATGNWYDMDGNEIAPSAVPDKAFGVYYATPAIAEEDMNQMVLVKKGNLMKVASAIRTKTGSVKGYEPAEFAEAILTSEV